MSTIYETIRKDSLTARKAVDKLRASLLITLMSEIQASGKTAADRENPSDEVSITTIKKFYKNAEASGLQVMTGQQPGFIDAFGKIKAELDILETYLPKQLTEDEIKIIIKGLKGTPAVENIMEPTMSNIMSYFKAIYPGLYDGALVAKHAR